MGANLKSNVNYTKRTKCLLIIGLLVFASFIIFLTVPRTTEVDLSYSSTEDAGITITTDDIYIVGAVKRYLYKPMLR